MTSSHTGHVVVLIPEGPSSPARGEFTGEPVGMSKKVRKWKNTAQKPPLQHSKEVESLVVHNYACFMMAGQLNSIITGKNSIRPICCYTFLVPGYINLHHNIQQFQQNIIQLGSLELKVGGSEGLMSLLFQGSSKLPMEFERLRLSQLYFSLFWSPLHICNFFTFLKVHQFEQIWRELLV